VRRLLAPTVLAAVLVAVTPAAAQEAPQAPPAADTLATETIQAEQAAAVAAYLQALYEVDLFLRWHQVWRWESTGLIQCESGGDWHINTGNGYYGGAQMEMRFWRAYGGPEFAARPDLAEPWQQATVLDRWRDAGGRFRQAFPECSRRLGLR
jgi:hypothetical protein